MSKLLVWGASMVSSSESSVEQEEKAKSDMLEHQKSQCEAMEACISDCDKDMRVYDDLRKIYEFDHKEFLTWKQQLQHR